MWYQTLYEYDNMVHRKLDHRTLFTHIVSAYYIEIVIILKQIFTSNLLGISFWTNRPNIITIYPSYSWMLPLEVDAHWVEFYYWMKPCNKMAGLWSCTQSELLPGVAKK